MNKTICSVEEALNFLKNRGNVFQCDRDVTIKDIVLEDLQFKDLYEVVFINVTFKGVFRGNFISKCDFRNCFFENTIIDNCIFNNNVIADCLFTNSTISDNHFRTNFIFENDFSSIKENHNEFVNNEFGASATTIPFDIPIACPTDGAFIGWKNVEKITDDNNIINSTRYLIKLRIPEDAQRCSANYNQCRCDKAEVLEIYRLADNQIVESVDEVLNESFTPTLYKVGEMVYPDSYDSNRWNQCSHGIHFFINKQAAINDL